MIELTRLNGSSLVLNGDLIQYAESAPDTTLTLLNGDKIVVRESLTEVIELAVAYRARVMGEVVKYLPSGMVLASGAALRALSPDKDGGPREEIEPGVNYAARRRATQQ